MLLYKKLLLMTFGTTYVVLCDMKSKLALCMLWRHWGIWRYSCMHFQPWYYMDVGSHL